MLQNQDGQIPGVVQSLDRVHHVVAFRDVAALAPSYQRDCFQGAARQVLVVEDQRFQMDCSRRAARQVLVASRLDVAELASQLAE